MKDLLALACGLAGIFLAARHLTWIVAVIQGGFAHGGHVALHEMRRSRARSQWRARAETLCLSAIGIALMLGWGALAMALLFWLLGCRVIRAAEVKEPSWVALVIGTVRAEIMAFFFMMLTAVSCRAFGTPSARVIQLLTTSLFTKAASACGPLAYASIFHNMSYSRSVTPR